MRNSAAASSGMATAKINASCALSRIDMVRAVTIITGPRTSGRMPLHTAFCRTATSLVSRVTSDEVLEYYKDTFPMEDLEALLPADLREALADQLSFNTDADGKTTAIALDMTQSRFVAGTGADADPNVQHTYYFFVPAGAPHPEQIVQFLRYSFGL